MEETSTLNELFESVSDDYPCEMKRVVEALITRFKIKGYTPCLGRLRLSFIEPKKKYVIKIPVHPLGCTDNEWEGCVQTETLDTTGKNENLGRTRLTYFKGIPLVFMEYLKYASTVEIETKLGFYPDWVGYIDCQQVGFDKNGVLKAFDWGRN